MSAQMVDAYLDELLAPLAEDALLQTGSRAEADSAADAAAAFAEAVVAAEMAAAPAPVNPPVPLPAPELEPELARAATPQPEPAVAEPMHPDPPPRVVQEAPRQPMPRHFPEPSPTAAPLPSANRHGGTPARTSQGSSGNRWLRAALGKDRYAFELLRVQEVVRMSPIIALRGTTTAMLGVMNLRGRVVPVFDLARWLGTGRVDPDEHARIIVVERDDELIGVLVSAVDDVVTLSREHIEPPLPGTDPGGMVGIARVGRLPTVLLDANALFD